jgi:hypothetical protein
VFGGHFVRWPAQAWALALVASGASGCAAPHAFGSAAYCAPPTEAAFPFAPDPSPPATASREEHTAALLGLHGTLASGARSDQDRERALERIEFARLAIRATAAELACESERARQAADVAARVQGKDVQSLTIASIGASAATAIAGVLLSTRGASSASQDAVAIGGGGVTAGLAIASLAVHPGVRFLHARNLLSDVWLGPVSSSLYPPFVWAYLTRPEFSNDGQHAIREHIVQRWRALDGVADDPALVRLIFGGGGRYDADTLRLRAAMLSEIAAEVDLQIQDVAALAGRILRD